MQDIADSLGVSKSAVSLAFRQGSAISQELRLRVSEQAQRLGYRPAPGGSRRVRHFLALVPDAASGDQAYSRIMRGIEAHLKACHHRLIPMPLSPALTASDLSKLFTSFKPSGLLVIGPCPARLWDPIRAQGLATVLVYPDWLPPGIDSVGPADYQGVRDLCLGLMAAGYRSLSFAARPPMSERQTRRWEGYASALRLYGLRPQAPRLVGSDNQARRLAARLSGQDRGALVCSDDALALRMLATLKGLGIAVPQRVGLSGFGDSQAAHLSDPPLSSYRPPWSAIGEEAARLLCGLCESEASRPSPRSIQLHGEFMERASSAPIAQATGESVHGD